MTNASAIEGPGVVTGNAASEERGLRAASDDLRYGQAVIVSARWMLIAAGLVVALWGPGPLVELRVQIAATLLLAAINFYLHAQLLIRRPVLDAVVYAASIGDLLVITAIVAAQGGYTSGNYIFYYPAVLAFSVSFPRWVTVAFTSAAAIAYVTVGLATMPVHATDGDMMGLFLRVLTLAAVATCGALYCSVERERRERALGGREGVAR